MIVRVIDGEPLGHAAAVYSRSWQQSHMGVCTAEFISKHDPGIAASFRGTAEHRPAHLVHVS